MATSSGWKWYSCSNICFIPTLGSAQSKDATLKVDNMHCLDFASCSRCQGTPDHPSHTATLCNRCFTDQKRQIHYAVLLARNFCTNVSLCNVVRRQSSPRLDCWLFWSFAASHVSQLCRESIYTKFIFNTRVSTDSTSISERYARAFRVLRLNVQS